jgi:hypothetical protein
MSILNVQPNFPGQAGVEPTFIFIQTDDTIETVTTVGYLNNLSSRFNIPLSTSEMAVVSTQTSSTALPTAGVFSITYSNGNWSLTAPGEPGEVILPTIASHIATYVNTTGTLSEDPTTAISGGNIQAGLSGTAGYLASFPATASTGSLKLAATSSSGNTVTEITNASQAAARTYTIPDGGQSASNFLLSDSSGTQTINTGSLALAVGNFTVTEGNIIATAGNITAIAGNITATAGNVTAGSSGHSGVLTSFPSTAANGTLIIAAVNAGAANTTTISNSTMGQSSVISIPDPGASTAHFLLDTGISNTLAFQQFVGIPDIILISTGTWTTTRIAESNYATVHSAAAEISIIGIDITNAIRTAASKGFELTSFDVIYSIGTLAMNAHTVTLDQVAYANDVAVAVTSVPLTGTLSTATQANPYVTNIAVTTPAFNNTADSKYVIEVTTNNTATTAYDFYGIVLKFSQTIA